VDKTAAKTFAVLERLATRDQPLRVSEVAREMGIAKSNAHRILSTLVALGYGQRTQQGSYRPTLRLWEIGVQILNRMDVRRLARPVLEAIASQTDETVHLTILDGGEIVYIDKIESSHPVREFTRIGARAPAHCTATGKVMLAFAERPPDLKVLPAFTKNTIKDLRSLKLELGRIRRQGYAFNVGEYGAYINGVAAPVADHTGQVIASVVISGPSERLKPGILGALVPVVLKAGRAVSGELGFRGALPGWTAL
jgi:DNA-binding IclR family transcriptional regulator